MLKNSILASIIFLASTGCVSVLSQMTDEDAWNDYFKDVKVQYETQARTLASERTGIKILRQILETMPFRNFLISCDQRDCYQSQLVLAFDQAFRRVKEQNITLSGDEYTAEQKRFLEAFSYEKVLSWVEAFHRMLLSGVELRTAKRAMDLAHVCESSLSEVTEIRLTSFSPYLGGITYLPRPYYACLNDHWENELEQLLKETSDRLGIVIKTDEAKRWILQRQISPIYHKTLNDIFSKRKGDEEARWQQSWSEIEKGINWRISTDELIRHEVPRLRKDYHFLNLEAILQGKKQSKK